MWSARGREKSKGKQEERVEKDHLHYRAASRGGVRVARGTVREFFFSVRGACGSVCVCVRAERRMRAKRCAYGGRLTELDRLCLRSGSVVSRLLAIEAASGGKRDAVKFFCPSAMQIEISPRQRSAEAPRPPRPAVNTLRRLA